MEEEKPLVKLADKAKKIRLRFSELIAKTNQEHPRSQDVKALSDLLNGNQSLELWRTVASAGHMAELTVLENATAVAGLKECWKHRLQVLKRDLGFDTAPMLEQLLIQQAALCWLKLSLVELNYSSVMKQSITLTLGIYWEKRLTLAQKRFTQACETLTRVRRLSRNTPALQVNIAAEGGQQVNIAPTTAAVSR
ncbi:MAG: hypothetical protein LC775_17015 [Acidobacteria bacterium]|nr:hypothetical protein [Acidobacteriota bacterium]